MDRDRARDIFRRADAVCFDVDSTVIQDEGINLLAAHKGKVEEISTITFRAMEGKMSFTQSLQDSLESIRPSLKDFEECMRENPPRLTPNVATLVNVLHARGTDCYLVSGGFRIMINPVADLLSISRERLFANTILFSEDGAYLGFDSTEPTSHDGGKADVINHLREVGKYSCIAMVGDGANDLQAKPAADIFIGYGGVVERELIRANADIFVVDFEELIDLL